MNTKTENAFCSVPEMLLMLRAPGAGWLATLLAALDEASHDPDFNAFHRAILARCLEEQSVPAAVAEAARHRTIEFEQILNATADVDLRPVGQRAAG